MEQNERQEQAFIESHQLVEDDRFILGLVFIVRVPALLPKSALLLANVDGLLTFNYTLN